MRLCIDQVAFIATGYLDSARLCKLPKCHLVVTLAFDRLVLIYQHGPNPEHRFELDAGAWHPRDGYHPALAWLDRVHYYEAGIPQPIEVR